MAKNIKLTPSLLKKIVLEEKRKIMETLEQGKEESEKVKAEELDADEQADALEKDIDDMQHLLDNSSAGLNSSKRAELKKDLAKKRSAAAKLC